jgi:hypothetical protein
MPGPTCNENRKTRERFASASCGSMADADLNILAAGESAYRD